MATKVNKENTVTLQDGREIEIGPLNIKNLRKFMEIVEKFQAEVKNEIEAIDIMVDACQVALNKWAPDIAGDREYLEENMDMPTIHKIMDVTAGIDMSGKDPNVTPRA